MGTDHGDHQGRNLGAVGTEYQPWRFAIIQGSEVRNELAKLTKYNFIIEKASACIAVFIDKSAVNNEVKDHQAMGACMQNMLLAAHALIPFIINLLRRSTHSSGF